MLQLVLRQGQHRQKVQPPGERLSHAWQGRETGGSSQDKASRACVTVEGCFDGGENHRELLKIIDAYGRWATQKVAGIGGHRSALLGVVQVENLHTMFGCQLVQQGGLADGTRPCQGDNRLVLEADLQNP